MLFNSLEFLIFLIVVFIIYWTVNKRLKFQNILLLVSSYVFYGWWDYRFLILILVSTILDYIVGIKIHSYQNKEGRKKWLFVSVIFNLGLLGFFKYYNFFVDSWVEAWSSVGYSMDSWTLKIILPVGISFYTFQTMSYSIDIYNNRLKPTKDFISFAAFVSFFPQLVAGPIERATNLLPQILQKRNFEYKQAMSGVRLIVWGLFKKVVIADSLSQVVNEIFNNYTDYSGGTLVLGAIFFAFQIYGDFSGYSDIAIGTAKLFGIELMSNFNFPYFARSIAEFWRRWHISLSTWFRDYLYIPIGGSQGTKLKSLRNIFVIFIISGFWHGANWTFIMWGLIHALLFIPSFVLGKNRNFTSGIVATNKFLPSLRDIFHIISTFILVTIAWIFFRSPSIGFSINYISSLSFNGMVYKSMILYPAVLLILEWFSRKNERNPLPFLNNTLAIILLSLSIFLFRYQDQGNIEFIYFQF